MFEFCFTLFLNFDIAVRNTIRPAKKNVSYDDEDEEDFVQENYPPSDINKDNFVNT